MHLIHFERGRGRGEKEEEGKGGRDTDREVPQLLIHSTNDPKNQDRASRGRSRVLNPRVLHKCRWLSTTAVPYCFPRSMSRDVDQKQSIWELSQFSEMLASKAVATQQQPQVYSVFPCIWSEDYFSDLCLFSFVF